MEHHNSSWKKLRLEAGDALEMESTDDPVTLRPVRGTFRAGQPLPGRVKGFFDRSALVAVFYGDHAARLLQFAYEVCSFTTRREAQPRALLLGWLRS